MTEVILNRVQKMREILHGRVEVARIRRTAAKRQPAAEIAAAIDGDQFLDLAVAFRERTDFAVPCAVVHIQLGQ